MRGRDVLLVAMISEACAFNNTDSSILLGHVSVQTCSGRLRQCGCRRPSKNEGDLAA